MQKAGRPSHTGKGAPPQFAGIQAKGPDGLSVHRPGCEAAPAHRAAPARFLPPASASAHCSRAAPPIYVTDIAACGPKISLGLHSLFGADGYQAGEASAARQAGVQCAQGAPAFPVFYIPALCTAAAGILHQRPHAPFQLQASRTVLPTAACPQKRKSAPYRAAYPLENTRSTPQLMPPAFAPISSHRALNSS